MKTRVKTVPVQEMDVGQWFLWDYNNEQAQPYRVVSVDYEKCILYPDGSVFRDMVDAEGIPIDGPDVDFDEALEQATEIEVPEPVPGMRFRWDDEDEVGVIVDVQWGKPDVLYAYYEDDNAVHGTCTRYDWERLVHGANFGRIIVMSTPDE